MKSKLKPGDVITLNHEHRATDFILLKVSGGRFHLHNAKRDILLKLTRVELDDVLIYVEDKLPQEIEQVSSNLPVIKNEIGISKVFKPIGLKTQIHGESHKVSLSEFAQFQQDCIKEHVGNYTNEYQDIIRAKIEEVEIGGMYYMGSASYGFRTYIVDGFKKKPHRYRKERKEPNAFQYYLLVRQWDWETKSFGPMENKSKGYEFEYDLEEFVKNIQFPKLSKTPDKLWEEAEKALLDDDVEKYAMDKAQSQDANGPDTQLMHLGSKEALMAVQKDLEAKRGHAVAIQNTMAMVAERKKQELEKVIGKMDAMLVVFEKQIKKIMRVITTIELYLGIEEEIYQIQEGPLANPDEPISIRQGLMFMDEEVGDPWDDGQGLEWDKKGVAAFDDWLTRNGNYKKVLPEKKGIAAFQARRDNKKRASYGNPFANLAKMESDFQTFLLIRNGDNLYRLITDKISFLPRLFPRRAELQELLEYWKLADDVEAKAKKNDSGVYMSFDHLSEKEQERFARFKGKNHRETTDAKEYAEDNVFFYKMRITLFQGLIDRATILQPLKPDVEYKLFSPDAQEKGLVRLIYDDELTLPSHKKPFWEWMEELNSTIDYGSRIVLSHNWSFKKDFGHREMEDYEHSRSGKFHQDRLDDRYGSGHSGHWEHIPPFPTEGMYFVKKGERWQNEPIWIDNPWFNPDLIETEPEARYCPDYQRELYPKNLKHYGYSSSKSRREDPHVEVNPGVRMTYEQQIAYFGKVVEKGIRPDDDELRNGIHLHGILKNPRKIHKYTMVPVGKWENGKRVPTKEMQPKFENHDVKYNFPCIRYNPKDMVGEYKMIRSRYDDDPTERKLNISWKIYKSDAFIINYDAITIEDIDFYLESRVDRRFYTFIMPLLWKVRQTLVEERNSEVDFKKLVAGEVMIAIGLMPTDDQVDQAVEEWKKNLKWKRAISHDDMKALRMIVRKLVKQLCSN